MPLQASIFVGDYTAFGGSPSLGIPDGNPSGVIDKRTVTTDITAISSVTLSLDLASAYNGDLYIYLAHGPGMAVLLNRPGRTAADVTGYADSGLNITLSDSASNGDIHIYQAVQTPAAHTALTGAWRPDGRTADPDQVTDNSGQSAFLSAFNGMDANGNWTLFLADLNSGAGSTLNSWQLTITGVPEPREYVLGMGLALMAFAVVRPRRKPSERRSK